MEEMLKLALEIRENAYAPYSQFKVGAVVKCANGKFYAGCNVENASYGLSICAERAAIFAALAGGEKELVEILLATETLATPCGACRQVMEEFGINKIHTADVAGRINSYSLAEILPHSFSKKDI